MRCSVVCCCMCFRWLFDFEHDDSGASNLARCASSRGLMRWRRSTTVRYHHAGSISSSCCIFAALSIADVQLPVMKQSLLPSGRTSHSKSTPMVRLNAKSISISRASSSSIEYHHTPSQGTIRMTRRQQMLRMMSRVLSRVDRARDVNADASC